MERSDHIQGSYTVPSPSGQYLAAITPTTGHLRILATSAPEQRYTDIPIRVPVKEITALRWNGSSDRIALVSSKLIEIVDLNDASHRVRLDNGSGGFGKFVAADFVSDESLLVVWEFGKAKVWDLVLGKGVELGEVKGVCEGEGWALRPLSDGARSRAKTRTLAALSRVGAEDVLNLFLFCSDGVQKHVAAVKLPTADAKAISWSPDGRWLSILDTPASNPNVHFLTPDGHLYRSYPSASRGETGGSSLGLGIKSIVWSGNSQTVALTRYDARIILLNTRTFAPLAVIEHSTTIDQRQTPTTSHPEQQQHHQAPIWQESVSASGERSYTTVSQPFSPPLTHPKPTPEPTHIGVAEAAFSSDGAWLATREERMLNTAWIWDMSTLGAYAVVVQHSNIRRMHWRPSHSDAELLLDCGGDEGVASLFSPTSSQPPTSISASLPRSASISWVRSPATTSMTDNSAILATSKSNFRLLYPHGRPDPAEIAHHESFEEADEEFEEGASEDSLFAVLSGRKPLPPKTEQSYTERVDFEVATEDEDNTTIGMDDTFREKQYPRTRRPVEVEVDPLDDSDIF